MDSLQITRLILYFRDLSKVAEFYQKHFGFTALPSVEKGWIELVPQNGGCSLALHQAAVSQKRGSEIKIVFGVNDVQEFKDRCLAAALKFGETHKVGAVEFSNAKDPAGNSIQISNRGMNQSIPAAKA